MDTRNQAVSRKKSLFVKIGQGTKRMFKILTSKLTKKLKEEKTGQYPPHLTLIDINELANILGVTKSFVYSNLRSIPHTKISPKILRFRISDLNSWLDSRTYKPQEIADVIETFFERRKQ